MNDSRRDNLPDDQLLQIEHACDEFEAGWLRGEAPPISDVVNAVDSAVRGALLEELIPVDLAYRRRAGESISAADYHARFPELDTQWLTECFMIRPSEDGLATNSTIDFEAQEIPGDDFERGSFDYSSFAPEVGVLLEQLASTEVLDVKTLEQHREELSRSNAETLAATLQALELLTPFQIERLNTAGVQSLTLNDYVLLEPLGQGGMGVVYKARHRRMDRIVALKTLHPRALESADALDRFRREAKAAARLSHPNIVQAFDAGEIDGLHYLVMEYVEGSDFARTIRESGVISARRAVHYIAQAAKGLAYAHKQGVIHRDIKPQNLLVDSEHKVKVLDMGLARLNSGESANDPGTGTSQLTKSGVIMGTVDFMAPEQAVNTRNANEKSDMYSLGCTLHFLLTGNTMYQGETFAERLLAHHNDPQPSLTAVNSKIPQSVEDVFFRMTAKQPSDRYDSMDEVEKELIRVFKQLNSKGNRESGSSGAASTSEQPMVRKPAIDPNLIGQTRIVASETSNSDESGPEASTAVSPTKRKLASTEVDAGFFDDSVGAGDEKIAAPVIVQDSTRPKPSHRDDRKAANRFKTMITGGAVGLVALICVIVFWPAEKKVKKSDEPWVDLLKQVNLGSANAGDWQWQDEELHTDASTASRIALPFRPTGEYDFRITFTRHTGNDSIALIFVAGTAQATFEIDAWRKNLAGIQSIDDETIETNSTRVENQALRNGQKYAAEVRIRADRVEAYLDGTHLTTYHGNGSNLGMPIGWRLFNDRTSLGIGAWDSSTTFHSVEIRTLSGPH
jgi:eukaryotic-like serine/threonine-protein kinase